MREVMAGVLNGVRLGSRSQWLRAKDIGSVVGKPRFDSCLPIEKKPRLEDVK